MAIEQIAEVLALHQRIVSEMLTLVRHGHAMLDHGRRLAQLAADIEPAGAKLASAAQSS